MRGRACISSTGFAPLCGGDYYAHFAAFSPMLGASLRCSPRLLSEAAFFALIFYPRLPLCRNPVRRSTLRAFCIHAGLAVRDGHVPLHRFFHETFALFAHCRFRNWRLWCFSHGHSFWCTNVFTGPGPGSEDTELGVLMAAHPTINR
jgi:hypothetical protein